MENKAKITVALPLWNSREIAWLFLESMCGQQHPGVPWEIVVLEERHDTACGYAYFQPYLNRLSQKGGSVRYVSLPDKMSLPNKWLTIAKEAAPTSEVYCMCAADNYYQPHMLSEAWYGIHNQGADWFQSYRCHFYDIDTGALVRYHHKHLTGIEMAMRTELARKIRPSEKKRVIDLHVLRSVKPNTKVWNESDSWIYTVCTHGRNNISGNRRKTLLNEARHPFRQTHYTLEDVLPQRIYNKIISVWPI